MNDSGDLMRFVGRVHRRRVAVRLLEQAGIGAAAGAVMVWGKNWDYVFLLVGVGAVIGLLVGWWRRPSRMNSAVEVDRQLGLKELLSSALGVKDSADPWRRAVVAAAGERVRGLSTDRLKFRRVGTAGWCVIGAFVLMSMGVRLMMDSRHPAEVATTQRVFLDREELNRPEDWLAGGPAAGNEGVRAVSEDRSVVETPPAEAAENPQKSEQKIAGGMEQGQSTAGSTDQAGAGSAQSDTRPADRQSSPASGGLGQEDAYGRTSGGSGKPADRLATGSGQGSMDGSVEQGEAAPPWHSDGWAADRQAAMEGMRNGQVPGRYQRLVLAYFEMERP